jgi:hypothetical protein
VRDAPPSRAVSKKGSERGTVFILGAFCTLVRPRKNTNSKNLRDLQRFYALRRRAKGETGPSRATAACVKERYTKRAQIYRTSPRMPRRLRRGMNGRFFRGERTNLLCTSAFRVS